MKEPEVVRTVSYCQATGNRMPQKPSEERICIKRDQAFMSEFSESSAKLRTKK